MNRPRGFFRDAVFHQAFNGRETGAAAQEQQRPRRLRPKHEITKWPPNVHGVAGMHAAAEESGGEGVAGLDMGAGDMKQQVAVVARTGGDREVAPERKKVPCTADTD